MKHHYKATLLALLTLLGGVSAEARKVEGSGTDSYTNATATVDGDNFVLKHTSTSGDATLTYTCQKSDIDAGDYITLSAIDFEGDKIDFLSVPAGVKCSYDGATYEFKVQNNTLRQQSPFNGRNIRTLTIGFAKNATPKSYYNNGYLERITFTSPELSEIGIEAFAYNTTLKEVAFNASAAEHLKTIGRYAFYGCTALTSISWNGTSELTEGLVNLPAATTFIGENAFSGCVNIKEVSFAQPSSGPVTRTIDMSAFLNCSGLTEVNFAGAGDISWNAFRGCYNLSTLSYISRITCNPYSFKDCTALTTFLKSSPSNDNKAYESAFEGCTSLPNDFISTFSTIGDNAFANTKVTNIKLNSSLEAIGNGAFKGCESLSEVTLNEGLQTIGDDAFNGSDLTHINLPSTLTAIGKRAFHTKDGSGVIITSSAPTAPSLDITDPASKDFFCNGDPADVQLYFTDGKTYTGYDKLPWTLFYRSDILQLNDNSWHYHNNKDYGALAAGTLSYKRTGLAKGQYATFCLPFDISLAQVSDIIDKVYCINGMAFYHESDGTLQIFATEADMQKGTIKAGTPFIAKVGTTYDYVVFLSSAEQTINSGFFDNNPAATDITVFNYGGGQIATTNKDIVLKFGGTYHLTYQTDTPSYMTFNTDATFGAVGVSKINAFRAYLQQTSPSTQQSTLRVKLALDGEATGIADIEAAAKAAKAQAVYTLDGRTARADGSFEGLPAGIYVKGGRKVVVK